MTLTVRKSAPLPEGLRRQQAVSIMDASRSAEDSDEDNNSASVREDGGYQAADRPRKKVYIHRCPFKHVCSHNYSTVSTNEIPFNIVNCEKKNNCDSVNVEKPQLPAKNMDLVSSVSKGGCGSDRLSVSSCEQGGDRVLFPRGFQGNRGDLGSGIAAATSSPPTMRSQGCTQESPRNEISPCQGIPLDPSSSSPGSVFSLPTSPCSYTRAPLVNHLHQPHYLLTSSTGVPSSGLCSQLPQSPSPCNSHLNDAATALVSKGSLNVKDIHYALPPPTTLRTLQSTPPPPPPPPLPPTLPQHTEEASSVRQSLSINNNVKSSEIITPTFRQYCRNFFLETLCPGITDSEMQQVVSAVDCLEERVYLHNSKSKKDYLDQLAKKLYCIQEVQQTTKGSLQQRVSSPVENKSNDPS